jgi:hypothetical protein
VTICKNKQVVTHDLLYDTQEVLICQENLEKKLAACIVRAASFKMKSLLG